LLDASKWTTRRPSDLDGNAQIIRPCSRLADHPFGMIQRGTRSDVLFTERRVVVRALEMQITRGE